MNSAEMLPDKAVVAKYWRQCETASKESKESITSDIECLLCPNGCKIQNGRVGICGVRKNIDGKLYADSYGKITSIALDPIEKKPLYHFHSGRKILSVGSYGCNFTCPFCQNYQISKEYQSVKTDILLPQELAKIATQFIPDGNVGVAYTYNEPLIGYEYVFDCSRQVQDIGLLNVLVTNGYISSEPFKRLLPYIDALNIDIKGGAQGTHNKGMGTFDEVVETVRLAHRMCHVEVTTLIVPNENEEDVEKTAKTIASIDRKIPYHLSRFFPRYKYENRQPTPNETMHKLRDIAARYLDYVYLGNI